MYNKENRIKNQYWIDPTGKCYYFEGEEENIISLHYEIATLIYPDSNDPENILMSLGWIMVGSSVYYCPIIHKKPTQAQINILYDLDLFDKLCFLHNNSYPNYAKYGILLE